MPQPPSFYRSDGSSRRVADSEPPILIRMVIAGKVGNVISLIAAGAPLDCTEPYQQMRPVLSVACATAAAAAGAAANPGRHAWYGSGPAPTALELAALAANAERIVVALLDGKYEGRGADVNKACGLRHTPLMEAAGHAPLVRLLLSRRADQKLQDVEGRTALHYAAVAGSAAAIVELHNDRDVRDFAYAAETRDRNLATPFQLAARAAATQLRDFGITS